MVTNGGLDVQTRDYSLEVLPSLCGKRVNIRGGPDFHDAYWEIHRGAGALEVLEILPSLCGKRVMVVADPAMTQLGFTRASAVWHGKRARQLPYSTPLSRTRRRRPAPRGWQSPRSLRRIP